VEWKVLAQDRDWWRTIINALVNLQIPQNAENFLLAENLLASQEGLCSMERVSE
jgi:hypothetical protein